MTRQVLTAVLTLVIAAGVQPLAAHTGFPPAGQQAQGATAPPAATRRIGAIKAINGNAITLAADSGPELTVTVQSNARILRIAPGEKDLKNATPITFEDLKVNDRIMVGGKASDDSKSIEVSVIVAMKRSDLEAQQQKNLDDWKKRGVDGVVKSVDPNTGSISLSVPSFGSSKEILVHTSKGTIFRRYAPGSANFADAKLSTLSEIRTGDQLRARGNRNAEGSEVTAEEIVAGSFRNISGTIVSVDAAAGTITVHDLSTKKAVTVKVTSDSLLRKLPTELARFAIGMKGGTGDEASNTNASSTGGSPGSGRPPSAAGLGGGGMGSGRARDLNRMLSLMPAVTVSDLQKGDAVLIVATEATPTDGSIVTKLLSGAEPLLRAAPSASQALMLTPWNLGAPAGESGN